VADQDQISHACHYRMHAHDCKHFWLLALMQ
jgi:hypothetical protein